MRLSHRVSMKEMDAIQVLLDAYNLDILTKLHDSKSLIPIKDLLSYLQQRGFKINEKELIERVEALKALGLIFEPGLAGYASQDRLIVSSEFLPRLRGEIALPSLRGTIPQVKSLDEGYDPLIKELEKLLERVEQIKKERIDEIQMILNGINPRLADHFTDVLCSPEFESYYSGSQWNTADMRCYNRHDSFHAINVTFYALKITGILLRALNSEDLKKYYTLFNLEKGDKTDLYFLLTQAGLWHDVGNAVDRRQHEVHSCQLALDHLKKSLSKVYDDNPKKYYRLLTEILRAIYLHNLEEECLSLESATLRVADAIDCSYLRAGINGKESIKRVLDTDQSTHVFGCLSISDVQIREGKASEGDGKYIEIIFIINKKWAPYLRTSSAWSQLQDVVKKKVHSIGSPASDFFKLKIKDGEEWHTLL